MLSNVLRSSIGTKGLRRKAFLKIVLPPSALAGADYARLASQLEPLFGHDLADQPPIASKQLSALVRYDATLKELASLRTLVICAARDPIVRPGIARLMAEAIPCARLVEISDASHGACIQHAARINELLLEHLGRG